MLAETLPYVIPLLLVVVIAIPLSLFLFRERKHVDVKILLSAIFLSVGWAAGYSFELLSANIESKVFWAVAQYPFISLLPVAWYAFAIRVAGLSRLLVPKYLALLCIIPLIIQPIIWTNDLHHLFWRDLQMIQEGPFLLLDIEYGPAFWVINIYSLLLVGISTLYLISVGSFTSKLRMNQRIILITIPLLPAIANFLYTQRWGPVANLDLTPFAFLVAALVLAYGFVLYRLDHVMLVARGDILDKLPQATIVLDQSNCLVDANQSARQLCAIDIENFYGKKLAEVPESLLQLVAKTDILSLNGIEICHPQKNSDEEETFLVSATEIEEMGQNIGLVLMLTNISEQKRANNKLTLAQESAVSARIEAEVANRAKSEFLSQMSHELRTPLNAVLGFAHILQQDNESQRLSDRQKKYLNHIEKGGEHLVKLIDDILSLATIEVGKVNLESESIEPLGLVDECIGLVRPLAEKSSINISIDGFLDTGANMIGDQVRVKQVVLNLLSNAIKYNRKGGSVEVLFSLANNRYLKISIKDTGIGIDDDYKSEVFVPFARLGAENTNIEGSGIGLAVCKTLVELMSGNIGFISKKDEGSTFWFQLPLSQSGPTKISRPKEQHARSIRSDIDNKRILYIEDNALNLALMRTIVENIEGVRFISAETAEHGLELVDADPPDMILMDISLPGMSGFEALARLNGNPETRKIPVVAVSAAAMQKDRDEGVAAGFVQYLTKPLDIQEVVLVINKILG